MTDWRSDASVATLRVLDQKLIFSFRMRGDYLIADEVRTRMDKQFERDLRLMKKVSDHNRVANNMYSRSENIGRVSDAIFVVVKLTFILVCSK